MGGLATARSAPDHLLGPGSPEPLGVTPDRDGVNAAVFSAHAEFDRTLPVRCRRRAGDRPHKAARAHRQRLPRLHCGGPARHPLWAAGARPLRAWRRAQVQSCETAGRPLWARGRPALSAASIDVRVRAEFWRAGRYRQRARHAEGYRRAPRNRAALARRAGLGTNLDRRGPCARLQRASPRGAGRASGHLGGARGPGRDRAFQGPGHLHDRGHAGRRLDRRTPPWPARPVQLLGLQPRRPDGARPAPRPRRMGRDPGRRVGPQRGRPRGPPRCRLQPHRRRRCRRPDAVAARARQCHLLPARPPMRRLHRRCRLRQRAGRRPGARGAAGARRPAGLGAFTAASTGSGST